MRVSGRTRLPMTSLIDVVFLLLLFFMLTSTFSRFGEIPITLGGVGASATPTDTPPLFVRVGRDGPSLNGTDFAATALRAAIAETGASTPRVIVSTTPEAAAQMLAETLFALRGIAGAQILVLE